MTVMAESQENDSRELDSTTSSMDIQSLNNLVVSLRGLMRKVQSFTIQKLVRQSKKLRPKEGSKGNEKKIKKADRLVQEVGTIKEIRIDQAIKYALGNTKTLQEVASKGDLESQAKVRLATHPLMTAEVGKWRKKHEDWIALAAFIMYKNTGRRFKKKKKKDKSNVDKTSKESLGKTPGASKGKERKKADGGKTQDDDEVKGLSEKSECSEWEAGSEAKSAEVKDEANDEDEEAQKASGEDEEANNGDEEARKDGGEDEEARKDGGEDEEAQKDGGEDEEARKDGGEDKEARKDGGEDAETSEEDNSGEESDEEVGELTNKEGSESSSEGDEEEKREEKVAQKTSTDTGRPLRQSGDSADKSQDEERKDVKHNVKAFKEITPKLVKAKPKPIIHKTSKEMTIRKLDLTKVTQDVLDIPVDSESEVSTINTSEGETKPKQKKKDSFFATEDSEDPDESEDSDTNDTVSENKRFHSDLSLQKRQNYMKLESTFLGRLSDKQAKGDWNINKQSSSGFADTTRDRPAGRARGRVGFADTPRDRSVGRGRGAPTSRPFNTGQSAHQNRGQSHARDPSSYSGSWDRRGQDKINQRNHADGKEEKLHPSWEAKRKRKEMENKIADFQGKKIKFDD